MAAEQRIAYDPGAVSSFVMVSVRSIKLSVSVCLDVYRLSVRSQKKTHIQTPRNFM